MTVMIDRPQVLHLLTSLLVCIQTIFLPVVGLVDPDSLKPGDLVGVNKDSYLILDTLPSEYDSRVKAMEVDEKPTEVYSDIGGLDKQVGLSSVGAKTFARHSRVYCLSMRLRIRS
jgi:hypothetical protein